MEIEKREIRIPLGAKCGEKQEPIYGWHVCHAHCLSGLAVHKAIKGQRWKWMVTHEASGMRLDILGANTQKRAIENMRDAVALNFDWTKGEDETIAALRQSRGIVDACRSIGAA